VDHPVEVASFARVLQINLPKDHLRVDLQNWIVRPHLRKKRMTKKGKNSPHSRRSSVQFSNRHLERYSLQWMSVVQTNQKMMKSQS
tara:strand:+ start:464 stop:721 length:258 start_codon:yes stop_codon:yes gene_type:complete